METIWRIEPHNYFDKLKFDGYYFLGWGGGASDNHALTARRLSWHYIASSVSNYIIFINLIANNKQCIQWLV